ncbi:hypothetical protein PV729_02495 [Streptomyces europaeiscabiei]|uniref:Secreted protein n=1 Tax=Streptomyces europaeiscabiei TaxID=146819 RepID=A0ABU4N9P6_9ACTN|nr:hypothetical protein [Streptomyces europaeiscabiei]MDX3542809.1 hypothetical protein [Streptomyces europaeiscabiei]MDX3550653.1 hypothetical protein [Streptomyces europaeiscabiei]MDX3664879.1 hypothetical protein [Streptomyces europaeiscabiei]MDX3698787.1 hypothetical protein [Streptomyces europaeiscabiei]
MRARGRRRGVGVVVLAGWLFADLLLVLTLVSMADRPDPLAARLEPSAGPSPTASPSPSPTGPQGVARTPSEFKVRGTDADDLEAQIRSRTAKWKGRTAALVLTFGGGQGGTEYAHRVNGLLAEARPEMFGERMATDDFHDLGESAGTAVVRVYFYTRPGE